MTDGFTISEEKVQTGYIDQDGKFVPLSDQPDQPVTFVQTGEDAQSE